MSASLLQEGEGVLIWNVDCKFETERVDEFGEMGMQL
jgi:hypothetical protein